VTKGDLTRSIQVEARGEVAELKDNINTMIDNLRATTDRNQEQDWLKTNLAKFTSMLQGQRDLVTVGKTLLSELSPLVSLSVPVRFSPHDKALQAPATPPTFSFTSSGDVMIVSSVPAPIGAACFKNAFPCSVSISRVVVACT
jgi:hypothetical protein